MKHAMSKEELAAALAEALNIFNDIGREELSAQQAGYIDNLLAKVPAACLLSCDYRNNGTMSANDLLVPNR